jgi:hypothetical protein
VKQIHISKEEELRYAEAYEKEQEEARVKYELENQTRINAILPKTQQLFRNRSGIGIALKRYIKKNLNPDTLNPFINEKTVFLLRVESKQNGKRFNATIEYEPGFSKWRPYHFYVDRKVPWSAIPHHMDGKWKEVKRAITNSYNIIEMYPF